MTTPPVVGDAMIGVLFVITYLGIPALVLLGLYLLMRHASYRGTQRALLEAGLMPPADGPESRGTE
jgi:hypothetical protein